MNKIIVILFLGLILARQAVAAEPPQKGPWKIDTEVSFGITQAFYSNSWAGGESGSISWVSQFYGKAARQLSSFWFWQNELKLAYGQTHTQIDSSKHWEKPKKSTDKIRFDTILKLTPGWFADPYAAGTFESQFVDQTDTLKTRYINPIDLTESVGLSKTIFDVKDKRTLTTRIGVGVRQRIVKSTDPGDIYREITTVSKNGGAEWVTDLTIGTAKTRYGFISKLTLFQSLFNFDKLPSDDPKVSYWKTADLNWDNTFRADITSILQATLAWQLLYDKEITLSGRFKETLALGLAYKFANYSEEKK